MSAHRQELRAEVLKKQKGRLELPSGRPMMFGNRLPGRSSIFYELNSSVLYGAAFNVSVLRAVYVYFCVKGCSRLSAWAALSFYCTIMSLKTGRKSAPVGFIKRQFPEPIGGDSAMPPVATHYAPPQ